MKETITIPEGAGAIEISKCSDKVIIEFAPEKEAKKLKFKVGDKVKVKKGFPYEGRVLTIKDNSCIDMNCPYSVEEIEDIYFPEHALELYDTPQIGEDVIGVYGIRDEFCFIGRFSKIVQSDIGEMYRVEGVSCNKIVKWDGTREHLNRVRKEGII